MNTINEFTAKFLQAIGTLLLAMFLFVATASLADEAGTLLVVGNSLGKHGPAPSIGWNADNGMAASAPEYDYAHLLLKKLNLATGKEHRLFITRVVDESNIGSLPAELPKQADVVVLQIGDNYKQKLDRAEAMRRYRALVTGLKRAYPSAAIVCVSPWKCAGGDFMQEAAKAEHVPFANIKPLGGKPGMDGIGYSSWAVNWHPGDRGMEAIADTIWEKLSPQVVKSRATSTLTGVVPEVQEASLLPGEEFLLTKEMHFHAPSNASAPLRHLLEELSTECGRRFGIAPAVAFDLHENDHLLLATPNANAHYVPAPSKGYDAYSITIAQNAITISAAPSGDGLFYGLQTLRQLLDARGAAPSAVIHDWADQKWRIAYLGFADPAMICSKLARLKINMVIVESYWNGHRNWWYRPESKNLEQAQDFIKTAQMYNLEVVPLVQGGGWAYGVADRNPFLCEGVWIKDEQTEVSGEYVVLKHPNVLHSESQPIIVRSQDASVTYTEGKDYEVVKGVTVRRFEENHAPWKLKILPDGRLKPGTKLSLDYNYVPFSPHQSPYCPSDPDTYKLLHSVLSNVVKIYHPRFIHIGHDEVIRRNTDRRCIQRGLDRATLAAEDLNWWYKTLKTLDPTITIMIWDDMVRKSDENGRLLSMLPDDIIICPWHYHATNDARKVIADRVQWFIGERHRPTIGTASGYFPMNTVIWNEELAKYAGAKENLGMMFTHWGESIWLWSSLPYTADCMWSSSRPNSNQMRVLISCDEALRQFALRPSLDVPLQMNSFANSINAGENKLDALKNALAKAETRILADRMPGFGGTDNPIFESIIGQGRRIVKYYEAMRLARKLPLTKDANLARRYFTLLKELMPEKSDEWTKALAAFLGNGSLPDTKSVFGVEILPGIDLDDVCLSCKVIPLSSVNNNNGKLFELCVEQNLYMVQLKGASPGEYAISGGPSPDALAPLSTVVADAKGNAKTSFKPRKIKYIQVRHKTGKEAVTGDIELFAVKEKPSFTPSGMTAEGFVTKEKNLARLQTTAVLKCTDKELTVCFDVMEAPDTPPKELGGPIYEDDCVQFFLREKQDSMAFLHVTVNCKGKLLVLNQNGRSGSLPQCAVNVKSTEGNNWQASFSIPLSELNGTPDEWAVNFTRNSTSHELSSYIMLSTEAPYWFLQPDLFVGKVKP